MIFISRYYRGSDGKPDSSDSKNEKFIFSLTSTLSTESNKLVIAYEDFWKNGKFKIALDKKYKNANNYISDRINILSRNQNLKKNNYELLMYNSRSTNYFLDNYLIGKLSLKGKNNYVEYRSTNADENYRTLIRNNFYSNKDMRKHYLHLRNIDIGYYDFIKLIDDLIALSNEKSFIFQRKNIFDEITSKYPKIENNVVYLKNIFDECYNIANALSVDSRCVSSLNYRLNGVVLSNFLAKFDKELFDRIKYFTPSQVFLLANIRSWQLFVDSINMLYCSLFEVKSTSQLINIANYVNKSIAKKNIAKIMAAKIINMLINTMTCFEPSFYQNKQYLILHSDLFIDNFLKIIDKYYFLAVEIDKRCKATKIDVDDIFFSRY